MKYYEISRIGYSEKLMGLLINILTVFTFLSTLFMVFLTWLAKDSKDKFAKKLRKIGWTGVGLGYTVISLDLFGYLSFLY